MTQGVVAYFPEPGVRDKSGQQRKTTKLWKEYEHNKTNDYT